MRNKVRESIPGVAGSLLRGVWLIATLLLLAGTTHGETVTQPQAKAIATTFFNAANGRMMPEPKMVYNGRQLTTQRLFVPFYIYNLPSGNSFVIISAENKAFPILGYSLKETFDPNNISEGTKALLRQYAFDVERIRYDDRIPYEAIEAWNNLPAYIANLLDAPYDATDPKLTPEETEEAVEYVVNGTDTDDMWSDIYSPEQWTSQIDDEMSARGTVAVGFIAQNGNLTPAAIHGRKGDFYRIRIDKDNNALYRLLATEFLNDAQVAMLANPVGMPTIEEEEPPFTFYDNYTAEMRREREKQLEDYDNRLIITNPVVRRHGSGFFTVDMPEETVMTRVYNAGGALVRQYLYRDTTSPHIELLAEPSGFYFALLLGKSGKTYGVKLAR